MKKLRRAISITIALILFAISTPLTFASELKYEKSHNREFLDDTLEGTKTGGELYQSLIKSNSLPLVPDGKGGMVHPPQWIMIQSMKCYINYRLWVEKNILVYGNYKKVIGNEFKLGTQLIPGVQRKDKDDGYYLNPYDEYSRGEWRYHGYDVSGNKYSNINFIDDSTNYKFDERNWIIKPWDNLPPDKSPAKSLYNQAATGDHGEDAFIQSHVQTWINKSLDLYKGVPLIGGDIDPQVYNYLNVLSAPTPLQEGQGRMWHKEVDDAKKGTYRTWYQTITIPRLTKENKDVSVSIEPLTFFEITDFGEETDNDPVVLQFKVTATLNDTAEYNDLVKKTVYYTRVDIDKWKITLNDPATESKTGMTSDSAAVSTVRNQGIHTFIFHTTYGFLREHDWTLHFTAKGQPLYKDGKSGLTGNAALDYIVGVKAPPAPISRDEVVTFSPRPDIPETAFDGVPFAASDKTDMSQVSDRKVYVDGTQVNDEEFFSGSYVFTGNVGINGRFAYVDCKYILNAESNFLNKTISSRDVVYIYPTKPIANFKITSKTWRQNRIINVIDTSNEGNIQLVIDKFPIVEYRWTYGGDTTKLRRGVDASTSKELLYKEPGIYSITMQCKNTLGKWSDPYTVEFQVLEDVGPAVGVNLSDSVTNRSESISAWYYNVASTDGDVIKSSSIELWHDSDNDGTVDRRINTWNNAEEFPAYTPTKLGYYKYIVKAKEDIVEDTLPQYITEDDKKSAAYEVEFWVDNHRPMSDLYVNIPIQRPHIDVYFMLDKNLGQAKKDFLVSSKIDISNWLIGKNIIPDINIWDMHTYTYSQPASTTIHTGGTYPSETTDYSSNGYSGTLNRIRAVNNQYSKDEGHYSQVRESRYFSATVTNSRSWSKNKYGIAYGSWSSSQHGNSYSINEDGYSDSISRISTSYSPSDFSGYKVGDSGTQTATGYFGGTLSKTVTVWVPNIVWYNDYTGYYSGTINKDVRQPYTDPFNPTSLKYVVYLSDGNISELNDLAKVKGLAMSAKLLVAGTDGIRSQIAADRYFDINGKNIDKVLDEILQYIGDSSPAVEKYYLLQNQTFSMNVGNLDLENDSIIETGMQYVHDRDYFDNPTGAEKDTVTDYSDSSGWTNAMKSSFDNVGRYEIYRRIKDKPSTDPAFSEYSYYSGVTNIELYVHRKPIALATLDWDYDSAGNVYDTTWVDKSYDLDHQFSRADKGIVERKIMYRLKGGEWIYNIPDNLAPGVYELRYFVRDPEGAWSDPFILNFTLDPAPPIQFNANLRALDSRFRLTGIPASEFLEAFNLWTRYPYNVRLEMAIYNGVTRVTPVKTVNYSASTGIKTGNDISWNDISYQIPETLPDRRYTFEISAVGDHSQISTKVFDITIATPINLTPQMPEKVVGSTSAPIGAVTSRYASSTQVTLFNGTPYQATYSMNRELSGDTINWTANCNIPGDVPSGTYTARFTARTPNGNIETKDVLFRLESMKITGVSISGYWNHWRGQKDIFGKQLSNEPHRFLSLECVKINIDTIGDPDKVAVRFSPQLEAMTYTDPNGYTYDYKNDYFGYYVDFPEDSTFNAPGNHVYWEYYLPLAPSTKSWEEKRLRPPYRMTVTAYKGDVIDTYIIDDIEITGNIYDQTYIQPVD